MTIADIQLARGAALSMRRKVPRHIPTDDLVSCAYVALMQSAPAWDGRRFGLTKRAFLWRRVRQRMIDQLRAEDEVHRGSQPQFTLFIDKRSVEAEQETQTLHAEIRRAVGGLPHRLCRIIEMRYYGEMEQSEIGRDIGVGANRISQLEKTAILKLRERIGALSVTMGTTGKQGELYT